MKSVPEDAAIFREEAIGWQQLFGLTDWTLQFKSEPSPDGKDEAECDLDCDTRHATMTFYYGVEDALHPSDVALHEVLHLLLADLCVMAIAVARLTPDNDEAENHPLLGRIEHMLIERLIKVLAKRRKKAA